MEDHFRKKHCNISFPSMDAHYNSPQTSMNDLNVYTLAHILSFFPVADRMRYQIVSKHWQEACRISLCQLTNLECFDHLDSSDCTAYCRMNLQQLRQALPLCGYSMKYFHCIAEHRSPYKHRIKMKCDKEFFRLLSITCPNLEILDAEWLHPTNCGLDFAAKYYNNLKEFRMAFDHDSLNEALINFFANAKRLKSFRVYWKCDEEITRPNFLEKLPAETLESLTIVVDYNCHNLTTLITNAIKNCYKLSELDVEDLDWYPRENEIDSSAVLSVIHANKRQYNFTSLWLTVRVCDNAMIISTFKNLQSLDLDIAMNLSSDTIKAIGNGCKLLSFLSLGVDGDEHQQDITDEAFVNFPNLEDLRLSSLNQLTGTFFNSMPKLKTVVLNNCFSFDIKNLKILFDSAKSLKCLRLRKYYSNLRDNERDKNLIPLEYANKSTRIYYNYEMIV